MTTKILGGEKTPEKMLKNEANILDETTQNWKFHFDLKWNTLSFSGDIWYFSSNTTSIRSGIMLIVYISVYVIIFHIASLKKWSQEAHQCTHRHTCSAVECAVEQKKEIPLSVLFSVSCCSLYVLVAYVPDVRSIWRIEFNEAVE